MECVLGGNNVKHVYYSRTHGQVLVCAIDSHVDRFNMARMEIQRVREKGAMQHPFITPKIKL